MTISKLTYPYPKIGILGGGQLGQMLAAAAIELGFRVEFIEPSQDSPTSATGLHIGDEFILKSVKELSSRVEVLTYEFENIPCECLGDLQVFPPKKALEVAQDRLNEKNLFNQLGIPTNRFINIENNNLIEQSLNLFGGLGLLKARRFGYDGKSQLTISSESDLQNEAVKKLLQQPCIFEEKIDFDFEVSLIMAFGDYGQTKAYPLVKNFHHQGILRHSTPIEDIELWLKAVGYAKKIAEALSYRGILTIEFFVKDGELIANEIAPRVHNTGHWTIEGATSSQFSNHIRAILGLPLGEVGINGRVEMWNILGPKAEELASWEEELVKLLKVKGAKVHLYGKEPQYNRKIGHVTLCSVGLNENEFKNSHSTLNSILLPD
jgi:5-(carboxyamino)imidazole ribonucleotide synthase